MLGILILLATDLEAVEENVGGIIPHKQINLVDSSTDDSSLDSKGRNSNNQLNMQEMVWELWDVEYILMIDATNRFNNMLQYIMMAQMCFCWENGSWFEMNYCHYFLWIPIID